MPTAAHPVRQRGQALPFAVFLLIASTAVMLFSLNAGQVTVEKTRITNAADAAAYSAGVTLARALNYGGYTNRAMIANEVAVAQAVSAASWTNYALNTMTVGPRERIAFRVGWVIPADDMSRACMGVPIAADRRSGDSMRGLAAVGCLRGFVAL